MKLEFGAKTYVMGILNVTPDSFSDGGIFYSSDAAIHHAADMVDAGADIIDIGAESTRPNFAPVEREIELARLKNIIPAVKKFGVPISIDTYKPEVAEFALSQGADIINNVGGFDFDGLVIDDYYEARMVELARKFDAPLIAMHHQKYFNHYDVIDDIRKFFQCTMNTFSGVQFIFDVGIGFGKLPEENLTVLKNLRELKKIDGVEIPLMIGVSRKSVIGYAARFEVDQRDEATGAICVLAIEQGVDIVRVHNVKMIERMCRMADVLVRGELT